MISLFDIYKIGVGPSSSHTVGPMRAGWQFSHDLHQQGQLQQVTRIAIDLYGSLALTGKGHLTDTAVIMGLAGWQPDSVDTTLIAPFISQVERNQQLSLVQGAHQIPFHPEQDLQFHPQALPLHENGLRLTAFRGDEILTCRTWYSVGGGFIVEESAFGLPAAQPVAVPWPYASAADLLQHCEQSGLSLSTLMWQNERALHSAEALEHCLQLIWQVMQDGIARGIASEGVLPGKLRVPRRAAALHRMLISQDRASQDPMNAVDWLNLFALAVSEENAAGGRVVTAPTNGACGIIPAVLAWYDRFHEPVTLTSLKRFLLSSSAIGSLYKMNASISGAEVGCQGEVGVACSMAAAGIAELMGGSPQQVCIAAEIAMEHNLGLTCDPVAGQVQVPCIERNAIAAVKAVNAARMALRRNSQPCVSLDKVIAVMYETGKDMHARYRETSQGGLAVKVLV